MVSKTLKWSYYNLEINIDDGMIIYNSATGTVLKVTNEKYLGFINEHLKSGVINVEVETDEALKELINGLSQKRILVDAETDELDMLAYVYNNQVVRNNILELTLVITRQCNYRCVYCYEKHMDLPMSDKVYNSILKLMENVYNSGQYNGVSLSLFGGEPLLEYDKFIPFLKAANEISARYNKAFFVGATTNGALLFPERFLALNSVGCNHFQITVDGLRDTHNKYRIAIDGNDWDVIIQNLKFMASTDCQFEVTLRTNFNEEILEHIDDFFSFVSQNFDDRFNIYYEGIKHLGGTNEDNVSVLDNVSANLAMVDISDVLRKHYLKSNVCTERLHPFSHICQAAKYNSFVIDYDGTVLKCTLDFDNEDNKVGYLSEDGEIFLHHEKHCKWLSVGFEKNNECKICKLLPLCYGRRCVSEVIHKQKMQCNPEIEALFLIEEIKSYYQ